MKFSFFTSPLLLLSLIITACQPSTGEFKHSSLYFGTLIDITLYDVSREQADNIFNALDRDFEYFHNTWTPWAPSSVTRVNTLIPTGAEFSVGPSVIPLIQQAQTIADASDHLFNPAIGHLINLWQFHKHEEPEIHPPSDVHIRELVKQNPRLTDLHLNGIRMSSSNPAVQLNFGAFAKGYAIDLSMAYLKSQGVQHAIINTGGDLKAIGQHGKRPWRIGIQHPRRPGIVASLETQGEESIFTSGDYERYYIHNNKRYHHILDPRTGYPAAHSQSVTVIHHNSALADAAATALFVAGPDEWYALAKKLKLTQVMLIDQQGQIHLSPEMHNRITIKDANESTLIISPPL